MNDMSWMLNPKAIRQAKECISLVKTMTGIKLKLSDPEFLSQLHGYVDSSGSDRLGEAYARLIAMAGVGFVVRSLKPIDGAEVHELPVQKVVGDTLGSMGDISATVEYSGRVYPKYRSGLEFKGVYRGQPMYS